MAREFAAANTEYLETTSTPITSYPLAIAGWFNVTGVANVQTPFFTGDGVTASAGDSWLIWIRNDPNPNNLVLRTYTSSAGTDATTSTEVVANTWHHACGILATATDRRIFLDGGGEGNDTNSKTPATFNRTALGRYTRGSPIWYVDGLQAEWAMWDLSGWPGASDAARADNFEADAMPLLADGYSPLFVPLGLTAYWSLIRDEDQDRVGGYDMTAYNTPTVNAHYPGIKYPAPPVFYSISSGAPPAGRTTRNTDTYGLGIGAGVSRTIKVGVGL